MAILLLAGLPAAAGGPPDAEPDPTLGPEWLEIGGELSGRFQWYGSPASGRGSQAFALHRTRVDLRVAPSRDLSFTFQAQDSRAWSPAGDRHEGDPFDVSQAFLEYRPGGEAWTLRAGRQELTFGDERLIGADGEWCYLGQAFDSARVTYESGGIQLDWFAAAPVAHLQRRWNRRTEGVHLQGFYSSFDVPQLRGEVDAYLIWKTERLTESEAGGTGRGDRYTLGARYAAELGGGFDTNVELALQRGNAAGDPVRAWAGHAELGRKLGFLASAPQLAIEYNHGSGDSRPRDGVRNDFNDLYPTGHDGYGMPDPVPWSNMHSAGASVDWSPRSWLSVLAGARALWFAAPPEEWEAGGNFAGSQFSMLATVRPAGRWRIDVGYSYLVSRLSLAYGAPASMPFVALRYQF